MQNKNIEIMAPVGSYASLSAAIKAGADSIYFGIDKLNMRSKSSTNFNIDDLFKIVETCQKNGVMTYVTLNTIIYDEDVLAMQEICDAVKKSKATAIIASDMATITYAKSIGLNVHISTQLNVSNTQAVKYYAKYADTVVLARELHLNQIKNISKNIEKENILGPSKKPVKIEIFVHGAICVAISGKCYMSLSQYNYSANRGACLQACRRKYRVIEEETNKELIIDNNYIMSPKDLCTIDFLDQIINAGVSVLKIEGRARSPEYVYTVVKAYKDAIKLIKNKAYTQENILPLKEALKAVYNRGFWQGYYLGKDTQMWSESYGSQATWTKTFIGKISNYFSKVNIAECTLQAGELQAGDEILIIGPTTGVVQEKLTTCKYHENKDKKIEKLLTFPLSKKVRKNDEVYLFSKRT